jgi:hypothetical protein
MALSKALKITAFIVLLTAPVTSFSQVFIGTQAGLNFSTMKGDLQHPGWVPGGNFKSILGFEFSPRVSVVLEPGISMKGTTIDLQILGFEDSLMDAHTRTYTIFYGEGALLGRFSFPLQKRGIIPYRINPEPALYLDINIGPYFGYTLFGSVKDEVNDRYIDPETYDTLTRKRTYTVDIEPVPDKKTGAFHPYLSPTDMGIITSVGIRYIATRKSSFTAEVRYTMGFVSQDEGAFTRRRFKNQVTPDEAIVYSFLPKEPVLNVVNNTASINIGYNLSLGKKIPGMY